MAPANANCQLKDWNLDGWQRDHNDCVAERWLGNGFLLGGQARKRWSVE